MNKKPFQGQEHGGNGYADILSMRRAQRYTADHNVVQGNSQAFSPAVVRKAMEQTRPVEPDTEQMAQIIPFPERQQVAPLEPEQPAIAHVPLEAEVSLATEEPEVEQQTELTDNIISLDSARRLVDKIFGEAAS